jgi:hypothetical protein
MNNPPAAGKRNSYQSRHRCWFLTVPHTHDLRRRKNPCKPWGW